MKGGGGEGAKLAEGHSTVRVTFTSPCVAAAAAADGFNRNFRTSRSAAL